MTGVILGGTSNSLLNDLTFPPNIKSNREFGEFIKWSEESTVSSAIRYTNNQIKGLNSQKLNDLRQSGMTKEIAEKWANFYQVESVLTDTNPNAYARYLLMKALAEKL